MERRGEEEEEEEEEEERVSFLNHYSTFQTETRPSPKLPLLLKLAIFSSSLSKFDVYASESVFFALFLEFQFSNLSLSFTKVSNVKTKNTKPKS